jgi:uncharacterized protein YndB with AHSA1/START domain
MSDLPCVEVSLTVAAPPERVWSLVSDVTRVGEWGGECVAAQWEQDQWEQDQWEQQRSAGGPAVGARFRGKQVRGDHTWETTSVVIEAQPGVSFGWAVTDPANPAATWCYELGPDGSGGTVVRYRAVMGPGPSGLTAVIATRPELEERFIAERLKEHERNMMATLEAIKRMAEQG